MKFFLRIIAIARKEIRQLRRDRITFGMIVGIPIMQILIFGYAINTDLRHLRAAICDEAMTARSRRLVADIAATQVLDITATASTPRELESMMRAGTISIAIHIPRDFDRRVLRGDRVPVQLMIDGSDPLTAMAAAGVLGVRPENRFAQAPGTPPPTFERRVYYNPERRSAVQIVPALAGVVLTMTMILFTSIAIVRERERGTLEMLITTPVKSWELMTGKIMPYIAIGLLQISLILAVGVAIFSVPIRGDLLQFYIAAVIFITTSLAMGLFISTVAQTQFQAMQLTFFFFLPSILLSGFMFPFDAMPRFAQWIGEVLPLTHFLRLVRGILLRGATVMELKRELAPLAIFFAVVFSAAILRFRKRLD